MFKSLLENFGKKALVTVWGPLVSIATGILNAKLGLGLEPPVILAPAGGSIVYTVFQAIVDAVTKGITSSLKGTPTIADPMVPTWNPTAMKSGMVPPKAD
jgi:hypothetical protein